jgi:tetratricopeptide (TPR) repeat protein
VWRLHFSIPEPVYWVVVVAAGAGFSVATPAEAIAWSGVLALGVQGIARWHWHRGHGRRALILCRFDAHGDAQGRAAEAQELILTRLRDNLAPADASRVHSVSATIGTSSASGAARLRRRLRAWLLVYGRVTNDATGWAVFARVLTPVGGTGTHRDEHTRDVTPIKRSWGERVDLLSPNERVKPEEYPLTAAAEIESIVRGSAGQVALFIGDLDRAENLLRKALSLVPVSASPAIDALRVALAQTLMAQDDVASAVALLRERVVTGTASTDLLRTLHVLLASAAEAGPEDAHKLRSESIAVLREAAQHETDPQRDMTLFNLAAALGATGNPAKRDEATAILRDLDENSSYYRRAWYVHRMLGSEAWMEAQAAEEDGDVDRAREHYAEAGRRYAKAIRLRPRIRLFAWYGSQRLLWAVYPPAAILRANLADVHDALERRLRSKWQWWRCERKRDKLIRRGLRRFAHAEWRFAYANFDWAFTGRGDFRDTVALVYRSVAAYQYGDDDEAERLWEQAVARQPFALITRAAMLRDPAAHPLECGLPGQESTDLEEVMQQLGMPIPPPGPLPVGYRGLRARLFPQHEPTIRP